jgi:alpha-1,3/alpha-1,6-mannosyltransferase
LPVRIRSSQCENILKRCIGGYDPRNEENFSYLKELESLADSVGLKYMIARTIISAASASSDVQVIFFLSIPNAVKEKLLSSARLLIYTPRNEHLGIVPLEAMHAGLPVLAANEGGPTETVVDGQTGWLRDASNVDQWAEIMSQILGKSLSDAALQKMGYRGKQRVKLLFSKQGMALRFDEEINALKDTPRYPVFSTGGLVAVFIVLILGLISAYSLQRLIY